MLDFFPEYHLLKVNQFDDEAKGLKQANEVLDSLHLKASEAYLLQTEAEFKGEQRKAVEIGSHKKYGDKVVSLPKKKDGLFYFIAYFPRGFVKTF